MLVDVKDLAGTWQNMQLGSAFFVSNNGFCTYIRPDGTPSAARPIVLHPPAFAMEQPRVQWNAFEGRVSGPSEIFWHTGPSGPVQYQWRRCGEAPAPGAAADGSAADGGEAPVPGGEAPDGSAADGIAAVVPAGAVQKKFQKKVGSRNEVGVNKCDSSTTISSYTWSFPRLSSVRVYSCWYVVFSWWRTADAQSMWTKSHPAGDQGNRRKNPPWPYRTTQGRLREELRREVGFIEGVRVEQGSKRVEGAVLRLSLAWRAGAVALGGEGVGAVETDVLITSRGRW